MPSHLIHGVLVQMYYDLDGSPWNFATWKALTGVHYGLFPEDDKQLPRNWNRQTAKEIFSFFDQFRAFMTEDEKIKFSSVKKTGPHVPGRKAWRDWVATLWRERKMHDRITEVLSAENLHPYVLAAQSDSPKTWPPANMWIPLAIDPVALALFGEECYSDGAERLRGSLRNTTGALITRTWLVLSNGLRRAQKKIKVLELEAIDAFEDLDRHKLTKTKLRTVVNKVVKWKQVVVTLNTVEAKEKIEAMESELGRLMVGLDQKTKPTSAKKSKPLFKISTQQLQSLASREDVADIINMYRDCFNPLAGDTSQLEDQISSISFKFGSSSASADPGTEVESTMPPDHLSHNLGFVNTIPMLFNTHRHANGITPWDDATAFHNMQANESLTLNELRWHQLAGIHAILRRLLSKDPRPECRGILIADEVGLGKTLQSLATIAWFTECVGRQSNKGSLPPPPILTQYPYLGESKSIPDAPHLIVVPGTVLSQWASEIRIFLNPKAFDLFVYQTGDEFREEFWSESGPFARSNQPNANKIIVAPHSALSNEFSLLFRMPQASAKDLPWRLPSRSTMYNSIVTKTLFGLDFLTVTIDEAHEFRNSGAKHSGALALLKNAKTRIIMTATPLQTSTRDLASMGRLVGIDFFSSQQAYDEEKADMRELRRAKEELGDDHDPLDVGEDDDDPIQETQATIALRMQMQFEQRVLRRSPNSKNWLGEKLIELPGLQEHTVLLELQSFEREIHLKLAERLREHTMKAFASTFYLPSRMGATYPRLSLADKIPRFKTLEEWESRKSTKVDMCARMCRHLLSRDDAPSMVFEDGKIIFPEVPRPVPGEQVSQELKIIIYQEFPSFGPLVRDVFGHYEINHLYMDGHASYPERAKTVQRFNNDPLIRVLFFSSVGASGLNLTKASVVIFLDQPWSSQSVTQIRGRIYRQGQKMVVRSYHLLADETSDVVLATLARGKKNMQDKFLQKPQGQELLALMTRGVGPSEEDFLDDDELRLEQARNARMPKPQKTNNAPDSSTKPKGKSQTGSTVDSAASTSNSRELATGTGSSVQMDQELTHKAAEPNPIPIPKATNPPEPNPEGDVMGKLQSHVASDQTDVHKVRAVTRDPDRSPPRIRDSLPTALPTFSSQNQNSIREAEVGQRRGRSQYRAVPDSPEAQKAKKRVRVSLVSYASSPEKQPASPSTPDSDTDMFDAAQIQRNLADVEMLENLMGPTLSDEQNQARPLADVLGSQPVNSFPPSFLTDKTSNESLPIASEDEAAYCGGWVPRGTDNHPAAIAPRITSLTKSFSTTGIRNMSSIASDMEDDQVLSGRTLPTQPLENPNPRADESTAPTSRFLDRSMSSSPFPRSSFSGRALPTQSLQNPNLSADESTAPTPRFLDRSMSSSPFPRSAFSQQSPAYSPSDVEEDRRNVRFHVTEQAQAAMNSMNVGEKARYKRLQEFKYNLVNNNPGAAGPSSVTRKHDTPDIRRPSNLGRSERPLTPPPKDISSVNPFSRSSAKGKSKWE